MGKEAVYSVKKVSYGGLEQGAEMLAQIFQELFFDFVDQKVNDGLLVLDNNLEFIAGNEKGRKICRTLFPYPEVENVSCIQTARMIKKNFRLGYFQFNVGREDCGEVFDFSLFPKTLKQEKAVSCYLCTVGEKSPASTAAAMKNKYYGLLSKRQAEVVELMATGMGNREIAEQLNISEHTVHKHMENIRERLGVSNRVGILNKLNMMY